MVIGTGTIIKDRYEILQPLGEGGFAMVFRARDMELGRIVAIKFLKISQFVSPEDFERFQREARLLASLVHRNILSIYAFELTDESMPFIVMEYLQGQPLAMLIQSRGKLEIEFAQDIFLQACDGLAFAHRAGIVHRDLSPVNIFLTGESPDITVKIIDFGLSKAPTGPTDSGKLTKTGILVGNPAYMSPEQARAQPVSHLSDIYALGCIMYESLSGKPPLESDSPIGLLYQQQHDYPLEPAFSDEDKAKEKQFKAVILRCIQKDPALRFQSCEELASALSSDKAAVEILDTGNRKLMVDTWSGSLKREPGARGKVGRRSIILLIACCFPVLLFCWLFQNSLVAAIAECFVRSRSAALLVPEEGFAGLLLTRWKLAAAAKLYEDLLSRGSQYGDGVGRAELGIRLAQCYFGSGQIDRGYETLSGTLSTNVQLDGDKQPSDFLSRCALLIEQHAFPGRVPASELVARGALLKKVTDGDPSIRKELRRMFENLLHRSAIYVKSGTPLPDRVLEAIAFAVASNHFRLHSNEESEMDYLFKNGFSFSKSTGCFFKKSLLLNSGTSNDCRAFAQIYLIANDTPGNPKEANARFLKLLSETMSPSVRMSVLAMMVQNENAMGNFDAAMRYVRKWRAIQIGLTGFPSPALDEAEVECLVSLHDIEQARKLCHTQVDRLKQLQDSVALQYGRFSPQTGNLSQTVRDATLNSQLGMQPNEVRQFLAAAVSSCLLIDDEQLANQILTDLIALQRRYHMDSDQLRVNQLLLRLRSGSVRSPALRASIEKLAAGASKGKK